jgi:hypothetical protein
MESVEITLLGAALWGLTAIVKFVVTPSLMVAAGFSIMSSWLTTSLGAAIGVWGFWDFGKWWFQWMEERVGPRSDRGKRIFTPQRRRIVRWKNTLGWPGLLFVSGLISVPVASVVGAKYFRGEPGAKFQLMLAFAAWAALLSLLSWAIKQGLL